MKYQQSHPKQDANTFSAANIQPRRWSEPEYEQLSPPSHDFSHVDLFSHAPPPRTTPNLWQPKLTVGAPNDHYEQEADKVAEQVMSMASPIAPAVQRQTQATEETEIQTKPLAETITPLVQRQEAVEEELVQSKCEMCEQEGPVQRFSSPNAATSNSPTSNSPTSNSSTQSQPSLESRLNASQGGGSPLSEAVRSYMEPRFGTDFSQVRVHTDSNAIQMNRELGAQAFTHGQNVYFGAGKSPANDALTAHELTHVVQQAGTAQRKLIQRDIDPAYAVTQGQFQVSGATVGGTNLPINIAFQPNSTADYSNQISLIQIARVTNPAGANNPAATLPPGRAGSLRTTAAAGVEGGFFTDAYHNDPNATPNSALPPQYGYGPAGNPTGTGTIPTPGLSRPLSPTFAPVPEVGFKRSNAPADIKAARISDAPGFAPGTPGIPDLNFNFETVAKGEDVNKVYGALKWSFQIRHGVTENAQATVQNAQSATFDAALELHRNFYLHEPVIFYFELNQDTLNPAEISKIASVKTYLARFATGSKVVRASLQGFADQRGRAAHNLDLSRRRATTVRDALLAEGIPAAQINPITASSGSGATTSFTPDATTDQDTEANRRGNRRVVLTFQDASPAPAGGTP